MDLTHKESYRNMKDIRELIFKVFSTISMAVIVFFAVLFVWKGYWFATLLLFIAFIPFPAALYLYQKGHKTVGIFISILDAIWIVLFETFFVFSNVVCFHYQYFDTMAILFLISDLYQPRQRNISIGLAIAIFISFFICENYANTPILDFVQGINLNVLKHISLIITLIAMFIIFYTYSIQLSRKEKVMQFLVEHDALTGTFNRGYLNGAGEKYFANHQMNNKPFSIILLDIDDFKKINDQYGHQLGDKVLITMSETINQNIRRKDIFARYGGEEFVILLSGTNNIEAYNIAERIRADIESLKIPIKDGMISFTISIGVSTLSKHHWNFDQLLVEVDQLLYQSKNNGKNQTTRLRVEPI